MTKKPKQYKLKQSSWLLNDEKSVNYHLKKSDYFGTVATLANLLSHLLSDSSPVNKKEQKDIIKALNNLKNDSVFLQKNYKIVAK